MYCVIVFLCISCLRWFLLSRVVIVTSRLIIVIGYVVSNIVVDVGVVV